MTFWFLSVLDHLSLEAPLERKAGVFFGDGNAMEEILLSQSMHEAAGPRCCMSQESHVPRNQRGQQPRKAAVFLSNKNFMGWRDGSVLKNTHCSCRGTEFGSQDTLRWFPDTHITTNYLKNI